MPSCAIDIASFAPPIKPCPDAASLAKNVNMSLEIARFRQAGQRHERGKIGATVLEHDYRLASEMPSYEGACFHLGTSFCLLSPLQNSSFLLAAMLYAGFGRAMNSMHG